jgi:hypothetical protein
MRAEILDLSTCSEVQPAHREDGSTRPPYSISFSVRPCWRKPPVRMELSLLYESENIAYYAAKERQ